MKFILLLLFLALAAGLFRPDPLIHAANEEENSIKFLLTDGWEIELVNRTDRFPGEFRKFRGYDLWACLPVMTGRVVESPEVSNRFLQNIRRTVSDCIVNYHYTLFRELAHGNGTLFVEADGPTSIGPHWERSGVLGPASGRDHPCRLLL